MISLVVHNMSRSACICLFRIVMIKLTMLSGLYFAFITVVLQKLLIRERDYFPDVVCDYRAPDSCDPNNPPLPCCQRPEVTASGVMVVSSLLLMAAMTLVTLLL